MGYRFDFSFLKDYAYVFLEGAEMTILISLIAVVFGTFFGALLYFARESNLGIGKFKPLKLIAVTYIEVIRGTPILLQLCLAYSGTALFFGINIEVVQAAVIAISLNSAAYVSEIIRAGVDAVDKGQMEAAISLGMTSRQAMSLVILPQAVKNILPAIGNEFVAVIKESSIASVVGAGELMFKAKIVTGATYLQLEPLIVIAGLYFLMTFTLGRLMSYLERRMKSSDIR